MIKTSAIVTGFRSLIRNQLVSTFYMKKVGDQYMPKDFRHHIILSKHEYDLIQMCIRHDIESVYRNDVKAIQTRIELETLLRLSCILEERWYKRGGN